MSRASALAEFVECLSVVGGSIERPESGRVECIGRDGELFDVSISEFDDRIEQLDEVSFHVWFEPPGALYARLRSFEGNSVIEVGFEGCSSREEEALSRVLEACFRRRCASGEAVGLAIDTEGAAEDCDWDAVFLGDGGAPRNLGEIFRLAPLVVAGVGERVFEMVDVPEWDAVEKIEEYVLVSSRGAFEGRVDARASSQARD